MARYRVHKAAYIRPHRKVARLVKAGEIVETDEVPAANWEPLDAAAIAACAAAGRPWSGKFVMRDLATGRKRVAVPDAPEGSTADYDYGDDKREATAMFAGHTPAEPSHVAALTRRRRST